MGIVLPGGLNIYYLDVAPNTEGIMVRIPEDLYPLSLFCPVSFFSSKVPSSSHLSILVAELSVPNHAAVVNSMLFFLIFFDSIGPLHPTIWSSLRAPSVL